MKPKLRAPFFEIGTKNYVYGDTLLEYAKAADRAAEKYDIDVLFTAPVVEIRRVAENTERLIILAAYMDTLRPGRGMADILPEGLKAAGAAGVVVNHCERPMSLPAVKAVIDRARELDFLVFACADSIAETKAIAQLHPDIINPEPSELIGGSGGGVSDMRYVMESVRAVKGICPGIYVEQAAGITSGRQVYDFLMAGS
ncbi:MAG: triose-phosphate isomerase, partial [Oscillospiraceae bacterium]|nr:triose-phosphate isomerase [Oscillospiraceae bacterium]